MPKKKINNSFLRILANLWGLIIFVIFIFDFFFQGQFNSAATAGAVIYSVILALYVSSKEYNRWRSQRGEYHSLYYGEFYPILWSVAMIVFVIFCAIDGNKYHITNEFTTTYITILGIFILSRESRAIYSRKR
jgi:hypothetical protein